jgi:hypothetical protein
MATLLALFVLAAIDPAYVAVVVAVAGPLAAYLVAVRRFSGKIESSDASQLWEESRSIREWSVRELGELRERVAVLETDKSTLAHENRTLTLELAACRERVAVLEAQNA